MNTAWEVCEAIVKQSGSSFTSTFALLPAEKRKPMVALYAFCRQADDWVDEWETQAINADTAKAQALGNINRWHEELIATHDPAPDTAPIIWAVRQCIRDHHLPPEEFQWILSGMRMDLAFAPFADWAALFDYCDRVAGAVGRLSARIFGFSPSHEKAVMHYATHLGRALQLINVFRDGAEDWQRRRIYWPKCTWPQAWSDTPPADGSSWQALYSPRNIAAMEQNINAALDTALSSLPQSERAAQRVGLMMGFVYRAHYHAMRDAFNHHPENALQLIGRSGFRLPVWRKMAMLAQAWWQSFRYTALRS